MFIMFWLLTIIIPIMVISMVKLLAFIGTLHNDDYAVTFINDSPRVNGRTLSAEFSISKAVSLVECSLDGGQRTDCKLCYSIRHIELFTCVYSYNKYTFVITYYRFLWQHRISKSFARKTRIEGDS